MNNNVIGIFWMHHSYAFADFDNLGKFIEIGYSYNLIGYIRSYGHQKICWFFNDIDRNRIRKLYDNINFCKIDMDYIKKYCYDNFVDMKF